MPLSKADAEKKVPEKIKSHEFYFSYQNKDVHNTLRAQQNASYLLRPSYSSKDQYNFAVSANDKDGGVGSEYYVIDEKGFHCKTKDENGFDRETDAHFFKTLDELISHYNKEHVGLSNKPAIKTEPAAPNQLLGVVQKALSQMAVNENPNNNGNMLPAGSSWTGKLLDWFNPTTAASAPVSAPTPPEQPSGALPTFKS